MKFRRLFIVGLALLVTACGHSPSRSSSKPEVAVLPPANSDKKTVVVIDAKEATNEAIVDVERTNPGPSDLFDRLRAGFRLPEFHSKHVRQYERWNSEHPTYLQDLFKRGEPFLYYIVEELDKRNMPLDLALLPAVESAFKPSAYSHSSAGGLWQFVPATARHFGMHQDWWYDGRLDVLKATPAALDYLQELHQKFDGDWHLALAAYNAGQGTVRRAIKRNQRKGRKTRYEDLNLRSETVRYVPKLFALRNILNNPEKYGVTLPTIPNQPYFSVLELPGQINLEQFSHESGIALAHIRHLNAAHRRSATAPRGPHRLLVPISALDRAKATLDRITKLPIHVDRQHHIQRGDTLSAIAKQYDVSVPALQRANRLSGTSIRAGRTLMIPGVETVTNASAQPGHQPQTHRVVAGDTLWSIARRYRVKVAQLLNWNRLRANQILSLNQTLRVAPAF